MKNISYKFKYDISKYQSNNTIYLVIFCCNKISRSISNEYSGTDCLGFVYKLYNYNEYVFYYFVRDSAFYNEVVCAKSSI